MTADKCKILITGDFCPINRIDNWVTVGDYKSVFNDFLSFIENSDFAITNLECPITDAGLNINKTGPSLKGSLKTSEIIANSGFSLVTLANNHIMDYGKSGLISTMQACRDKSLDYLGAGESLSDARKIFFTKLRDFNVAILNFTENEFSTTQGNFPGANPIDPFQNFDDIKEAKLKADYVIVIVHGGHENFNLPSPRIKKMFHFFADAGASAVLQHHAHCYSGYELYKNVPIFYGLGNFVFDNPNKRNLDWNYGFAVELILGDTVDFNIIPYEQCNANAGIQLLKNTEKEEFFLNIEKLNAIIVHDRLLNIEFRKYCNKVKKMYFSLLEPHSIMVLKFLQIRKILPSFLSERKKILYLNLIRCESHRDVLVNLLGVREDVKPAN